RRAVLGGYSATGDITLPFVDLAISWYWMRALGYYVVTGSDVVEGYITAPYTHIFSPATTPLMHSFSAKIGKDIFEHIFLGNVVSSISLEVANEWALMTVSTVGAKDKKSTLEQNIEYTEGTYFTAPMASLRKNN